MLKRGVFSLSALGCVLLLAVASGWAVAYPAAKGFNKAASDQKAMDIADAVMEKMGGWENWNHTRYITWKFFGRRQHVWDKWTGRLRYVDDDMTILMNIHTQKGRVWRNGKAVTEPDSLKKYLNMGYRRWINDSYWLLMPYKLKDSGVTLKYMGEGKMQNGKDAYVLQLTFDNVGVTPQNEYEVYVNRKTMMVEEWAYYAKASDPKPRFRGPWANWTRHGKIMLSADRGDRKHTDVAVFDTLPDSVFESPEPVDVMAFPKAAP